MGLDPAFSLTANDQNITDLIAGRLMSLRVTSECDHQSDQLDLTLWDTDPHLPLIKPSTGAVLTLSLGTTGALVKVGSFVVSSLSGSGGKSRPQTMTIRARAAPYADTPKGATSLQTQLTRSWFKGTTIGAMVASMAARHGMKAGVSPSLAGIHLQHLDQTDESDLSFLQKLARHYDAIAKPAGGKLLFVARGDAQSASGKDLPAVSLAPEQVGTWSWDEDRRTAPGTVVALYHTTRKAATHSVSIGSGDPVTRLNRKFRNAEDANAAARAEMSRRARSSITLSLTMPGEPRLAAGTALVLSERFPKTIQGKWVITRSTHSLSKEEGLQTELHCERPNDDPALQNYFSAVPHETVVTGGKVS